MDENLTPAPADKPQYKNLSILSWAAVLVIIGLGYFFVYQKNNPTPQGVQVQNTNTLTSIGNESSDWKTYRNNQFGYEINYPSNLNLGGSLSDKPSEYNPRYPATSDDSIIFSESGPLRIESYQGKAKWVDEGEMHLLFIATTTFNGYPASKAEYCDLGGCVDMIVLEANGITYQINFDQSPLSKQILSTFRFNDKYIEQSNNIQSFNTTNWKIYKNDQYGFEIKYPSEFVGQIKSADEYFAVYRGDFMDKKNPVILDFFGTKRSASATLEESISFTFYNYPITASSTLNLSSDFDYINNLETKNLGGKKAYFLDFGTEGPFNHNFLYIIPVGDKTLTLSYSVDIATNEDPDYTNEYLENILGELKKIAETSISTLKFIK